MSGPLVTATTKHAGSLLHERMIEAGWSPDEIEAIEGVLGTSATPEHGAAAAHTAGELEERA